MQKISVEKNVPPPKEKSRSEPLYPWLTMKIGDSFVVHGRVSASSARGSFRRYQRMGLLHKNLSVQQRVMDDQSVRLWLVRKGEA